MSEEITMIPGDRESHSGERSVTFARVLRFYGGVKRGTCCQLSLEHGVDHIQLDRAGVKNLVVHLIEEFLS